MLRLDELRKRWEAVAAGPISSEMLGAGTRLAKIGDAPDEPRLVALPGAAHGRAAPKSLRCITHLGGITAQSPLASYKPGPTYRPYLGW
jgi:hypothetical protein